jgi:hypothetical protein
MEETLEGGRGPPRAVAPLERENKVYLFYFFLKIENCLQKSIIECRSKNYGSIGCIVNNLEFERLHTYINYSSGHLIIMALNIVHTFFPKIWYLETSVINLHDD